MFLTKTCVSLTVLVGEIFLTRATTILPSNCCTIRPPKLLMLGALIQQMKISVQTLAGKTITVMVDPSDTINVVMAKIQDQQRLVYGKKGLKGVNSIKLLLYRLRFQKTTEYLFFADNYQLRGRLFQKPRFDVANILNRFMTGQART